MTKLFVILLAVIAAIVIVGLEIALVHQKQVSASYLGQIGDEEAMIQQLKSQLSEKDQEISRQKALIDVYTNWRAMLKPCPVPSWPLKPCLIEQDMVGKVKLQWR